MNSTIMSPLDAAIGPMESPLDAALDGAKPAPEAKSTAAGSTDVGDAAVVKAEPGGSSTEEHEAAPPASSAGVPATRSPGDTPAGSGTSPAHAENAEGTKLFIGGLSWQTTEDGLREYFRKYGVMEDVALMVNKHTGQPRGFGFVRYRDPASAQLVLSERHTLDGRVVDVKLAVPKGVAPLPRNPNAGHPKAHGGAPAGDVKKIFVGGLTQEARDDDLRKYFEPYGNIIDAVVMMDRGTQRSRGFGFVTFDDPSAVARAMSMTHTILGKAVEVKRAEPKQDMNAQRAQFHGGYQQYGRGGFGAYGGGYGGQGGQGGYPPYGQGAYGAGAGGYGGGYGNGYGNFGGQGFQQGYNSGYGHAYQRGGSQMYSQGTDNSYAAYGQGSYGQGGYPPSGYEGYPVNGPQGAQVGQVSSQQGPSYADQATEYQSANPAPAAAGVGSSPAPSDPYAGSYGAAPPRASAYGAYSGGYGSGYNEQGQASSGDQYGSYSPARAQMGQVSQRPRLPSSPSLR